MYFSVTIIFWHLCHWCKLLELYFRWISNPLDVNAYNYMEGNSISKFSRRGFSLPIKLNYLSNKLSNLRLFYRSNTSWHSAISFLRARIRVSQFCFHIFIEVWIIWFYGKVYKRRFALNFTRSLSRNFNWFIIFQWPKYATLFQPVFCMSP